MRQTILLAALCLFCATQAFAQGKVNVKYDADKHRLSINAGNAPISQVIDALAKEEFQLFIIDLQKDFTVNANYNNAPVDVALAKIIPGNYKYFYRVSPKADKAMVLSKPNGSDAAPLKKQSAKTNASARDKTSAKLASAESLQDVSKAFEGKPKSLTQDRSITRAPNFKGSGRMNTAEGVKPASARSARAQDKKPVVRQSKSEKGKHLVVTYKVTKDGLEPVSSALADGKFKPQKSHEGGGDYAIVGSEGERVVFLETFENPLSYRSISDDKYGHKSFTATESFVTVKMPESYNSAAKSQNLKVQLASFKGNSQESLLKKAQARKMTQADVGRSLNVVSTAKRADFSKIRISPKGN